VFLIKIYSAGQIKQTRRAGHVAYMGKKRNAYSILVVKTKGKRPLGRPEYK
jgi:uncharacterized protein YlbG (UPF0298 family)